MNTLVLVHRTELSKQWQERLQAFLGIEKKFVGTIGGGKSRPTGNIDIAVMQSLSRQGEVDALVENYGQVIVDECHHIGAVSFDAILRRTKAKYVLGLTATPAREVDDPLVVRTGHLFGDRDDVIASRSKVNHQRKVAILVRDEGARTASYSATLSTTSSWPSESAAYRSAAWISSFGRQVVAPLSLRLRPNDPGDRCS